MTERLVQPERGERVPAPVAGAGAMLTIGLLGGMSWQSTAEYYRLLNEIVGERLGGLHSARCVLYSVDFAPIEAMQAQQRWDEAAGVLAAAARCLQQAGAGLVLLCTNTMHKVADQVQAAVSVPLLHIADVGAAAVKRAGLGRVALLATGYTMEQEFYRGRLAGHGLQVLVPGPGDRQLVHRIIYDELCHGVLREQSRQQYRAVMRRLIQRGAQGILLACTEIELLIGPADAEVPVFPTTRLHAEAAVAHALAAANDHRLGP